MLHLRLLVIALSALLSTSAALALNARGVENVEQIVDLIQYFDLYPICASYIDEPEFPHTSTHYVGTRTLIVSGTATITDSITQTTSSGTLDVTDLTTVTTTITYAAASNTVTDTTTDVLSTVTTTTYISTTTTTIFPAPSELVAKRDILPKPHKLQARDPPPRCTFPPEISGAPSSILSEACSSALATRTKTLYTVSTTFLSTTLTQTATSVDTVFTPATTTTDIITDTNTDSVPVTETITSDVTFSTVPTVTISAIATVSVCPDQQSVDAGGVGSSGYLNFNSGILNSLACCQSCFNMDSCGLWFLFEGLGCFTGVNANGPDANSQCPTGFGQYILDGPGPTGDVGGPGPCAGSIEA